MKKLELSKLKSGPEGKTTNLRQPRLAEMVADILRAQILSGELESGSLIGRQEDLIQTFKVSKPSIREALRILETEGLVTITRGNVGGVIVHRPDPSNSTYMLGLVLKSQGASVTDIGTALRAIEPVCASLCAERTDRHAEIIPRLREIQVQARACVMEDEVRFTSLMRKFHEELVICCGNTTLILLVGALEKLWSHNEAEWAKHLVQNGQFPALEFRTRSIDLHDTIIAKIELGDSVGVGAMLQSHLEDSMFLRSDDGTREILLTNLN